MAPYIKAAVAVVVVFFAVDFIWLSQISVDFYRTHIGSHLADEPNLLAAAVFYVLYLSAIMYFAVIPAIIRGNLTSAAFAGGALGLVCYGTYDLTNMATLSDWPVVVTVVDMIWGTFLTAISSAAGYWFATRSGGKSVRSS